MCPKPPFPRLWPALGLWLAAFTAFGQLDTDHPFAARAEAEFHRAQKAFQTQTNAAADWQFARACYDFAETATNATERAAIARQGIAACRQLLTRETNSAPGHYYLAMNFGQLASAEAPSLLSYRLVKEIEREFKTADKLNARFDFGGPARGLGLLYRDAPGWPLSIGSKRKARDWLERAAALAPDCPENGLNLAETHLKWHQWDAAEKDLQQLDALWPAAQTNFVGATWQASWHDWNRRREAVRAECAKFFPAQPAGKKP
jgi:tetratricopeptide (TPR) repeat protein